MELAEITTLAEQVVAQRRTTNRAKTEYDCQKEIRDALQDRLLTAMKEVGQKSLKTATGVGVSVSARTDYKVVDEPAFIAWAREAGYTNYFFEKVDPALVKRDAIGLIKERAPGIEKTETEYLSVRGVKEEEG